MDCDFCALEGTAGEASARCGGCGEWMCDAHAQFGPDHKPLCPSCFETRDEETLEGFYPTPREGSE
jgi:hypothetical protein